MTRLVSIIYWINIRKSDMRTYMSTASYRQKAIRECPFTPAKVVKVCGGYMCFESVDDYEVWKIQR